MAIEQINMFDVNGPEYFIICDLAFVPALEKYTKCKVEKTACGVFIKTIDPILCQAIANQIMKGYKLLFGSDYRDMILNSKWFTV